MTHDSAHATRVFDVELRLERQQAEHQVGGARHVPDPSRSPGPELRTHVLNGRDTRAAQPLLEAEVEIGRVDADEDVVTLRDESALEVAAQPQQREGRCPSTSTSPMTDSCSAPSMAAQLRGWHRRTGDAFEGRVGCDMAHGSMSPAPS